MNKKFLQSVVTGLVGLSLATSCSVFKKHGSSGKNSCSSSKKEESSKCSAEKAEAKKVSQAKKAKKHTKSEIK